MKYSLRFYISRILRRWGLLDDARKSEEIKRMLREIKKLDGGKIKFEFEFDEDGNWAVESLNVPGIVTGGTFDDNIPSVINDAVFTYYSIPAKYCDDTIFLKEASPEKHHRRAVAPRPQRFYAFIPTPALA